MQLYEGFGDATKLVKRRWINGAWADDKGGVCVGQSLLVAFSAETVIPEAVRTAVDAELTRRSRYYRYLRRHKREGVQDAIVRWNDAFWRKQSHVVSLLEALTHDHEVRYLRWRVEKLQADFRGHQAQRTAADEDTLADLEEELAWSWERLTCLTN